MKILFAFFFIFQLINSRNRKLRQFDMLGQIIVQHLPFFNPTYETNPPSDSRGEMRLVRPSSCLPSFHHLGHRLIDTSVTYQKGSTVYICNFTLANKSVFLRRGAHGWTLNSHLGPIKCDRGRGLVTTPLPCSPNVSSVTVLEEGSQANSARSNCTVPLEWRYKRTIIMAATI